MTRTVCCVAALFAASLYPQASQAQVALDKSFIRFVAKQENVPVEGRFKRFTATINFDAKKPEATKADFEVDLASVDLGSPEADTEMKRKTWFFVDSFPKAKFSSSSAKAAGQDRIEVSGSLSIKGIEQKITTIASVKTDAAGTTTAEGKFPLKRLAFKIGEGAWAATDTVADDVEVRYRFVLPSKK